MKEDEKQEQQKTEQPDEGKLDEEQKLEWASIDLKVRGMILVFSRPYLHDDDCSNFSSFLPIEKRRL